MESIIFHIFTCIISILHVLSYWLLMTSITEYCIQYCVHDDDSLKTYNTYYGSSYKSRRYIIEEGCICYVCIYIYVSDSSQRLWNYVKLFY